MKAVPATIIRLTNAHSLIAITIGQKLLFDCYLLERQNCI
jgi:hypothetical protein